MTTAKLAQELTFEVKWRARWLVKYFPKQACLRLRHCRGAHRGPLYDGYAACLTCGAPWFKRSL